LNKLHIDIWADRLAEQVLAAGPADELLTDRYMAEQTHVAPNYYAKLRSQGRGPAHITISRRVVRTPRHEWARWLQERAQARAEAAD
jgi:hypothetical protein